MNVTFTDEARIRDAAARLLAEELDSETRDRLLRESLAHLLTSSPRVAGGPARQSLHGLFTEALYSVAREEVERLLTSDPEMIAQIRAILHSAMEELLLRQRDKLAHSLARAFVDSMTDSD